ncbi:MAG: hypothetical protein JKY65_31605 [Planctomycetes bacterium]|nr:hypothetical protein [Planctomycetota bacterium]
MFVRIPEEETGPRVIRVLGAVLALLLATPVLALGPGLPAAVGRVASAPESPGAPLRLLFLARVQLNTHRESAARESLELWIELFADEGPFDFSGVMSGEGEWVVRRYGFGDGLLEEGFTPWLFPHGKPRVAQAASADLLAQVLVLYSGLLELDRDYPGATHIQVCLANLWPSDSPGQLAGEDGIKRTCIRCF